MREYAQLRGLRRWLLPVPLLTPHLSGLWLALVTPAQARVGRALVEGLKNPTVVRSSAAFDTFQIAPMPLRAALAKAIEGGARLRQKVDTRTMVLDAPPSQVFAPIRQIGGTNGWYFGNALWRARHWLDLAFGGVGMGRGRRDSENCALTDVIDGWTVDAYEPDRRLRLRADLKLPGRGWLEFQVTPLDDGRRSLFRQTATFDPRGLLGRAYWYVLLPVHEWMFNGLLHEIARRAKPRAHVTLTHERIRLGISACLLGEPVRFDGGHKRDPFLVESLGQFVDWVPVCPEVESGLDAPRESMRLVQTDGRIRLLTNKTAQDHTTRMHGYARRRVDELVDDALVGFVLKKDSPTCGLERVKVYGTAGVPVKSGRGLFAGALVTRFPLLPVEEEGRLNDPRLRENFVERIFAYRRLMALFATRWSIGAVVQFHTAHKLTLMAHMPEAYQRLGRLVASGKSIARREFQDRYSSEFMTALQAIATPRRQTNVLQHMLGYFKQTLDRESRAELLALIHDYGAGRVPLVVPLTLFAHHIRRCGVPYLADQVYLQPHPVELMLRNHV